MKYLIPIFIALVCEYGYAQEEESPSTEKLQPALRTVDRDWSYFKAISCDDINHIVFHSRSEELLVAQRKSECLQQYDAFLPKR